MCFDEVNFELQPNFYYKETISDKSDCFSNCNTFDYYLTKDNKLIIITPCIEPVYTNDGDNKEHEIYLIDIETKIIINKLKGHKGRILNVRIFKNQKNKKEYLISADILNNIIVWDIENNFEKIFEKYFEYEPFAFIYSTLMIFDEKNTWIVASCIREKNKTLILDMVKNKNFIEITESENLPVYCLCYWFNQMEEDEKDKHNIIQCGKNKILITQFPSKKVYYMYQAEKKYIYNSGGLVFKNGERDLLAVSSSAGLILIIDLILKNVVKKIEIENAHIFSFIKWNQKYLLLNNIRKSEIIIIDMNNDFKIVGKNYIPEMQMGFFMKKIKHPIYGESILISVKEWKLNLFIIRGLRILFEDEEY